MDGWISYQMAGVIAAVSVALGGFVAGVLVRYYTERSAVIAHIDTALDAIESKWDAKFEAHRGSINQSHREIHNRIERVEQRAEDRLTTHIAGMRKEMHDLFTKLFARLDAGGVK